MYLIKVQYAAYKRPRWVLASTMERDGLVAVKAIQKSRKTATRFQTLEKAEELAATITQWARKVEIVVDF